MSVSRFGLVAAGLALTAAACGSGGDDDTATTGASTAGSSVGDGVDPTTPTTQAPDDGGAVDLLEVDGDGRDDLALPIAQATEPWPTDWSRRTVDVDEFRLGIGAIDPRDRIPPIDDPQFEPIAAADWLDPREPGALVQFNGEVRFYPLSILTRHEIVNDRVGELPLVVTYCPLCNTAVAFDPRVDGEELRFGVSGLLRNSDLVMWDDATVSLWQQVTGEAVVGEFAGAELDLVPTSIVAYGDVVESFPDAISLSRETGFPIEYGANPYRSYSSATLPFLFDGELDERFPALSRVVGVTVGDAAKAYRFETLMEERAIVDEVGGVPIAVLWGGDTADALDADVIAESEAIGSGIAYDRRVGDQVLTFEPAGDDRFTDPETGSTWTLLGVAVDGPLAGEGLTTVTHRNEFWFAWAAFFPDAPVHGEE